MRSAQLAPTDRFESNWPSISPIWKVTAAAVPLQVASVMAKARRALLHDGCRDFMVLHYLLLLLLLVFFGRSRACWPIEASASGLMERISGLADGVRSGHRLVS
ncbi:hypothetical protein AW895_12475 [Pseudomonas aeruginosa]|nr:hypothetical protein AW895_12475 [Pseudomonas aeruginosa]KXC80398.1 hypothetical protein AW896_12395 [Pseudomonas aeruginosa]OFS95938.1 hypothetical protein HMPREF3141_08860 [Pseudomonas sp. HMSC16B01]